MSNLKIARKKNHLDSNITKEYWTMLPFYTYIFLKSLFQKIFFIIHFYIKKMFQKMFFKKVPKLYSYNLGTFLKNIF